MSPIPHRRLLPVVLAGTLVLGQLNAATAETADPTTAGDTDLTDVVGELREVGIGFGDIAHLTNLASLLDMDALELVETIPVVDGAFDFDFGDIKQRLDPEQRAALKDQAKAYRALVKAAKAQLKAENPDDDDMSDDEPAADESGEPEDSEPAEDDKAQLIADAFEMPVEDVMALRADGHGWGAMFRLVSLAHASGVTIDELLDGSDATGLSLGKLRKMLTSEELDALEKGPRNFGHLVAGKADKPGKPDKSNKGKRKQSTGD